FGLIQADVAVGGPSPLVAAILPSSRSVQVNGVATAFAAVINNSSTTVRNVSISPATFVPGSFAYQTTDPATNVPPDAATTPADIAPGLPAIRPLVLSFVRNQAFGPVDVPFTFASANITPPAPIPGVSTLLLSASTTPVADIVALAATVDPLLITDIPGPTGVGAFSVAAVNVGA